MIALIVLLALAFLAGIILAVLTAGTWRIFGAIVALAAFFITLMLLWPGTPVNRYLFPPATEAAPPYVAAPSDDPQVPVPSSICAKDGNTIAQSPNSDRSDMSYFGGTSEACTLFGEVNFGLSSGGKPLTVLIVIPAHWTLNMNGMLGHTFWQRYPDGIQISIADSTANLTRADGRAEATPVVVHVDNEAEMAGLTELVRSVYPAFAFKLIPPALP